MTALEIRLIAYAILGLFVIGGSAWAGHTLTARHYEALIARDRLAQDSVLQVAQQHVIEAQAAQHAAETKAESEHELLVKADTASRDAVLGSVHNLEAALHLVRLPATVGNPGGALGSTPVPGSDPELERAVADVNDATAKAIAACQHDSDNYAFILSIQPQVTP